MAAEASSASSSSAASSAAAELPPCNTLYVNNLNERIKRTQMKKALYTAFSQFGRVVRIICKGSFKLKGQSWIVFDDVGSAVTAKRQMTNCPIFNKPLHIQFAKENTRAAAHMIGTSTRTGKRVRDDEDDGSAAGPSSARPAVASEADASQPAVPTSARAGEGNEEADGEEDGLQQQAATLVVSGVPSGITAEQFTALFSSFAGFVGARLPPGEKGVGFADFADAQAGAAALRAMQGYQLSDDATLSISLSV